MSSSAAEFTRRAPCTIGCTNCSASSQARVDCLTLFLSYATIYLRIIICHLTTEVHHAAFIYNSNDIAWNTGAWQPVQLFIHIGCSHARRHDAGLSMAYAWLRSLWKGTGSRARPVPEWH